MDRLGLNLQPSSCVNQVSRVTSCLLCPIFLSFEETVSNQRLSIMSKGHLLSLTLLSICVNALSWQEFGRGVLVERPTGTRREPIRHFNSGLNDDAQGERQNSNIGRLIME